MRRLAPAVLLALAALPAVTLGGAQGETGSELGRVQAEIRRYGCHLPQYARSVPACRALNARAYSLAAQGGAGAYRPRYQDPRRSRGLFDSVFGIDPSYTPRRRSYPYSAPGGYGYGGRQDQDEYGFPRWRPRQATYRTLCVRLCDGYYWPISYSASQGQIGVDAQQCESSCGTPAALYMHRTGGSVEHMVDLAGKPYADLPTAFLYRKKFVAACRCKPEPWSEEAQAAYKEREPTVTVTEDAIAADTPLEPEPQDVAQESDDSEEAPPVEYWDPPPSHPQSPGRFDTSIMSGWRGPIYFFNR